MQQKLKKITEVRCRYMVTHIKGKTEHYISAERFMKKLGSENDVTTQIQGNGFRLYDFVHTASTRLLYPSLVTSRSTVDFNTSQKPCLHSFDYIKDMFLSVIMFV